MTTAVTVWYAVRTHPRAEEKALAQLRNQGYGAYLPRYIKTIRHARRTAKLPRPLFPCYLFVALSPTVERWRPIRSTVGVVDIVSFGDRPTPVPSGVIDGLMALEDREGFVVLEQRRMRPGSAVFVVDGPFASRVGLYEGTTDNERVAILLDLLGRSVRVILDSRLIEAA